MKSPLAAGIVIAASVAFLTQLVDTSCAGAAEAVLKWTEALPVPDRHGFAGMFAGVSHHNLIAAGGANFPEKPPWQGGKKVWHDAIYLLEAPRRPWRVAKARLPRGWAYGVSATVRHASIDSADHQAVLCVGGDDGQQALRDVLLLSWNGRQVRIRRLQPLPQPVTQAAGAVVGDRFYLAGGIAATTASRALHTLYVLEMRGPPKQWRWRNAPRWPGPERMQSVAAAGAGQFFLFGGVQLDAAIPGHHRKTPYLCDAYRLAPGSSAEQGKWTRIRDLPRPVAAAPTPALPLAGGLLAIVGGVDGSMVDHDQATHPGFTRRVTAYSINEDRWRDLNPLPPRRSRVTAPTVAWRERWAVVSGESRPGVRSPSVYLARQKR